MSIHNQETITISIPTKTGSDNTLSSPAYRGDDIRKHHLLESSVIETMTDQLPPHIPLSAPCGVAKVSEQDELLKEDSITLDNTRDLKTDDTLLDASSGTAELCVKSTGSENLKVDLAESSLHGDHSRRDIDEESSNSYKFLCSHGLKWSEKKTSRVGHGYQVSYFPEAGSYLDLQPGDDFDQLEQLLLADQIWDPLTASIKGVNDFIHLHCPSNKKEAALELLHQRGYDTSLFSEEIKNLQVLDGSDWSMAEHENFRRLMQLSLHNVSSVSKSMGKSINNCLTVYYNIIDEINRLKDISRSIRTEKRNEFKHRLLAEDKEDKEDNNHTSTVIRKRKKAEASDKVKSLKKMDDSSVSQPRNVYQEPKDFASVASKPSRALRSAKKQALDSLLNKSSNQRTKVADLNSETKRTEIPLDETKRITRTMTRNKNDKDKKQYTQESNDLVKSIKNRHGSVKTSAAKRITNKHDDKSDQDIWDIRFASLVEFKEKNGHCLVPKVYPENRQLSYWVYRQRGLYSKRNKKGNDTKLTDERLQRLKDIGFVFYAKNSKEQQKLEASKRQPFLDAKWEKFYKEFCKYKVEHGNCLIPKVYEENQALSSW
jgi:hypothetical protein